MEHDLTKIIIISIIAGTLTLGMLLSIPIYAIRSFHRRKLEEIKARQTAQIDTNTREAIEALRAEFAALRDTTTQYDVSFDTALHRIEGRLGQMEQRVNRVERRDAGLSEPDTLPLQQR
jgi:hypothetical protein